MNWSRAHWIVGLLTLLIFPLTGAYMRNVVHVPTLDAVPRLVFRSRHLYLMLAGVANLALSGVRPQHLAERLAGLLILLAPFVLVAAFFLDPERGVQSSPLFLYSMFGVFAAGVLLAIAHRPRSDPRA